VACFAEQSEAFFLRLPPGLRPATYSVENYAQVEDEESLIGGGEVKVSSAPEKSER
jgi:hypothetical protein